MQNIFFKLNYGQLKSHTLPFKETSLCSSFAKSFDMLPKQKLSHLMLSFILNLQICFIYIKVTPPPIVM